MKKILKLYRMFYRLLRLKDYQRQAMLSRAEMVADMRLKHMRYAYDTIFGDYRSYKNLALEYGCNSASELKATIESLYKIKKPQEQSNTKEEKTMCTEQNEKATPENADCRVQPRSRSNEDLLCELTREYCFVSDNLRKLGKAIKADPASVRQEHKDLWKQQAEHMTGYKKVLADRIKDILNNN